MSLSNSTKAKIVGVLIILAYSMLTYDITKNIPFGITTDIISGISVIWIALLMFPIFNSPENKLINWTYLFSKVVEGVLMIIGGLLILSPALVENRSLIYGNIHIWFFIIGALSFYILLLRSQIVPKFLSIWGIVATSILLLVTLIKLFGISNVLLDALLIPMILNELFLAMWLIIKGFSRRSNTQKAIN